MSEKLGDMMITIRGAKMYKNAQYKKFIALLRANGFDRAAEYDWTRSEITKSGALKILDEITPELPTIMAIDWMWVDDLQC